MRIGFRFMRQMVRRVLDIFDSKDISDNYISMETKHNELYEAPETRVMELKFEGIICQSNGNVPGSDPYTPGGDPFSF